MGFSGGAASPVLGLLRSPAQGKPARHRSLLFTAFSPQEILDQMKGASPAK
jgi:hypothetical protein